MNYLLIIGIETMEKFLFKIKDFKNDLEMRDKHIQWYTFIKDIEPQNRKLVFSGDALYKSTFLNLEPTT